MRSNTCLTTLHVSIMVLITGTHWEAGGADFDCDEGIKVRRNTVYEANLGHSFKINCPVVFCTSSKPAVSWFKDREDGYFVPFNVSSRSHITTEWEEISPIEGISYLIFKKVAFSDSGLYRCQSGNEMSHVINITVKGDGEFTTVTLENYADITQFTTQSGRPPPQFTFGPCDYRMIALVMFVIVVAVLCVASTQRCKGVCRAGEPGNAPDPSGQPSRGSSRTRHIYENDPSVP